MTIVKTGALVRIRGDATSSVHEAILRGTAGRLFDVGDIRLNHGTPVPPGWALLSEMTLRAVAQTLSATAELDVDSIVIRGLTADPEKLEQQLARVRRALLPNMQLDNHVATIQRAASLEQLCRQIFDQALQGRTVDFETSGDQLATKSYGLLDELIEIAVDCPAAKIQVTGHSDATGDETTNLRLSKDRARAVVAHMVLRGLSEKRLLAYGAGSSDPVAGNDNARERQQNRRIEFELSFN